MIWYVDIFRLPQFVIAAVDHRWLTTPQIVGALLATAGMFLLSMPPRKALIKNEVGDVDVV